MIPVKERRYRRVVRQHLASVPFGIIPNRPQNLDARVQMDWHPALPAIRLRTNGRGKVSVEGPVQRERPGELEPYDTFRCEAYCFQLVPPTPDGLGIPVDYEARTVAYKTPLDVPSLLVRAGALEAAEDPAAREDSVRRRRAGLGGAALSVRAAGRGAADAD